MVQVATPIHKDPLYQAWAGQHPWAVALDVTSAVALEKRWVSAALLHRDAWLGYRVLPSGCPLYTVQSSNGDGAYEVCIRHGCTCPDAKIATRTSAPFGWCKHRLGLWRLSSGHIS